MYATDLNVILAHAEKAMREGKDEEAEALRRAAKFIVASGKELAEARATIRDMQRSAQEVAEMYQPKLMEEMDYAVRITTLKCALLDTREALQNMMGIFDNPIARRLIGDDAAQEAREWGRVALEKWQKAGEEN